jgi:hypothetical protein
VHVLYSSLASSGWMGREEGNGMGGAADAALGAVVRCPLCRGIMLLLYDCVPCSRIKMGGRGIK